MGGLFKSIGNLFSTGKSSARRYEQQMLDQLARQRQQDQEAQRRYEQQQAASQAQFAALEAEQRARIQAAQEQSAAAQESLLASQRDLQKQMQEVQQQNLTLRELEGLPQDVVEVVPGGEAATEDNRQRRRRAPLDLGSILGIL